MNLRQRTSNIELCDIDLIEQKNNELYKIKKELKVLYMRNLYVMVKDEISKILDVPLVCGVTVHIYTLDKNSYHYDIYLKCSESVQHSIGDSFSEYFINYEMVSICQELRKYNSTVIYNISKLKTKLIKPLILIKDSLDSLGITTSFTITGVRFLSGVQLV